MILLGGVVDDGLSDGSVSQLGISLARILCAGQVAGLLSGSGAVGISSFIFICALS
jgi:hypothetical protein